MAKKKKPLAAVDPPIESDEILTCFDRDVDLLRNTREPLLLMPTIIESRQIVVDALHHSQWYCKPDDRATDAMIACVQRNLSPLWDQFINDASEALDLGWQPFKVVWTIKGGLHQVERFRPLNHRDTAIHIDRASREFVGMCTSTEPCHSEELDNRHSLLVVYQRDRASILATNVFGIPQLVNVHACFADEDDDRDDAAFDQLIRNTYLETVTPGAVPGPAKKMIQAMQQAIRPIVDCMVFANFGSDAVGAVRWVADTEVFDNAKIKSKPLAECPTYKSATVMSMTGLGRTKFREYAIESGVVKPDQGRKAEYAHDEVETLLTFIAEHGRSLHARQTSSKSLGGI